MNPRYPAPKPRRQDYVLFGQGPHGIGCLDRNGLRFYGLMDRFTRPALWELDVFLDSRDAANELPDGSLPV